MPIRAEFRKYYGASWRRYRAALILAHGAKCSACGRSVLKYLNFAHISHDPRNSEIRPLCNGCHNRHDAGFRLAVMRRRRARRYGQLWLWREIEWAPFPDWLIPRRAKRTATPEPAASLF